MGRTVFSLLASLTVLGLIGCRPEIEFEPSSTEGLRWFKGNTHAHTTNSDGDSPPETVANWYREHGYQFLVLSDHNVFTDPTTLSALTDSGFILIPGEEVTARFESAPVHVNGLNISGLVEPQQDSTLIGTIQRNVDAVRAAEGVPHINHPNFRWAFGAAELARVKRHKLFEIYNGHPGTNDFGGGGKPGMEAVWDQLLTGGKRIYGIAVDDAHHFQGEFAANRSNPGRAWVVVRAEELDAVGIIEQLEAGQFYASTGVVLTDIQVSGKSMTISMAPASDRLFVTSFIGENGRVLQESTSNPAEYTLLGDERYVRAKVRDSGGSVAWTQPVFVREMQRE